MTGPENYNRVPPYKWAKEIKELQDYTCVICGSNKRLEAHHIESRKKRPDLADDIENGVTLCHDCHYLAHFCSSSPGSRGDNIVRALYEYNRERVVLAIPKGTKDRWRDAADAEGKSLQQFIIDTVEAVLAEQAEKIKTRPEA